jgi:hypothetical protein
MSRGNFVGSKVTLLISYYLEYGGMKLQPGTHVLW